MSLTADELAAMRSTSTSALPDTCTISRATPTADALGGQSVVWANVTVGIACRFSPDGITDGERDVAGAVRSTAGWRFTFAHNVDVRLVDRIVVGTRTFEVVALDAARSWQLTLVGRCIEVL